MKVAKKSGEKRDKFVWWKKIERDIRLGVAIYDAKSEKKKFKDRKAEMERLKKRREERAADKARKEEELMMLQRQRVRAEAHVFEKNECEFVVDQFKAKSRIRYCDGRMKAIDVITLKYFDDEFNDVELDEPCVILRGLKVAEIEELRGEIELRLNCLYKIHDDDDRGGRDDVMLWEALMVVCDWELQEGRRAVESVGSSLHPSIQTDVRNFLQEIQSCSRLIALQEHIESSMRSGKAKVVEFWEEVLRQIRVYQAKAFLKEFHDKRLHSNSNNSDSSSSFNSEVKSIPAQDNKDVDRAVLDAADDDAQSEQAIIDPAQDTAMLTLLGTAADDFEACRVFDDRVIGGVGDLKEGELVLGPSAQVDLDSRFYPWHDIYRPRKPKFFVKYHTGYVWNQYNRTHYGQENPPPKLTHKATSFTYSTLILLIQVRLPGTSLRNMATEPTCVC